ncbi:MAG: SurA N-terminal domain-containing protein [Gammaproteobacteria bacterium]
MLQQIRDRAQGLIVWTIVGLIIITFALFGLSSYMSGSAKVNVATVNDVDISQTEFLRAYQNYQQRLQQMLGKNYNPAMFNEDVVKQQVLDGLITREVLTQTLNESGFGASHEQILAKIQSIDSFFDENGKFSAKQYKRVLALQGMNSAMFEKRISQDIADEHLYAGLVRSAFVTPKQIETNTKLQGQKRDVNYILVSHQLFMDSVKISDVDIEKYYADNKSNFMTPEMVSVEYLELDINESAREFEVSDDEIRQQYDQNIKQYEAEPEQRKASHILIAINDKTDEATAKTEIEKVKSRLDKGEDFAAVAKEVSQDPGSAKQGGDLGFFGRGVMDKAFEETAVSLKKGEISQPVKSAFGFHIIKVTDIKSGKVTPFKDVKAKIKKELQIQKAEQKFYTDIDTLNNLTYESPDSLQPAADALGLTVKQSSMFTRRGGQGIFQNTKVVNAAFSDEVLVNGRNSELVELSDTHVVVVRKKEHKPSDVMALDKVRSRIENTLKREQAIEKASQLAKEMAGKLGSGEKPESLVKSVKAASFVKAGLIGRKPGKEDAKVRSDIRQAAFKMPKPKDIPVNKQVALNNGDQAVVMLNKVIDGTETPKNSQQQLAAVYGNTSYDDFVKYLREQADIKLYPENIKAQQ